MTQMVKNLHAIWETWVPSLGWEDPMEESMTTHCSILAWRIPTDRGAWWTTVHRVAKRWIGLSDQAQHSAAAASNNGFSLLRRLEELKQGGKDRFGTVYPMRTLSSSSAQVLVLKAKVR